jgi:hypothetical protein
LCFYSYSFQILSLLAFYLSYTGLPSGFSFFFMKFGFIRLISSFTGGATGGGVGTFCLVADPGYFFEEVPRMTGFSFPPMF